MKMKEIIQSEYNKLSKGQQKVAQYFFEKPREFAVKSAQEIGESVGVSETTVIRFCYAIQLSGYSELQKTVRNELLNHESSLGQYYSSKLQLAEQPNFYAKVMERDREHIQDTINQIDEKAFNWAIEKLAKANTIFVSGQRSSFAAANWLAFTLGIVRENVRLIRLDTDDLFNTLSEMNEESVFIAISFHRYLKDTIKMAELAKLRGTSVIGITDSPLAPIRNYADVLIPIYPSNHSTIDAAPALFSFLNAVVAGVTIKDKSKFEKRKEQYDRLQGDYFYIDGGE